MAKKHPQSMVPAKALPERIASARGEGRTQQALALTHELCKQEPTEEHRELLRQVTLERGQQLQAQGKLKDAALVYGSLRQLGEKPALAAAVAEGLAACGAIRQALEMAAQIGDAGLRQRIGGRAADAALAQGPAGKSQLPADWQEPFETMLRAFAHSEAGRDEETRAALQTIGLQSPFLEWKMLLRGLLAYYAHDDARAIENWQRLDPQRLPARLAAPLRFRLDPAFRQQQPAAAEPVLLRQLDRLQGPQNVAGVLQSLRQELTRDNLAPAFRKAEQVMPTLRQEHPRLANRLAHCFMWAILDHGRPEDLDRYARVFGAPADDPHLHRLEALALEMRGLLPEAHESWKRSIDEVAQAPHLWPGDAGKHVQAMIWARMAENAGLQEPSRANARPGRRGKLTSAVETLLNPVAPPELKPSAEECLKKAIHLAPDRLASYEALFDHYCKQRQFARARKAGQELLRRFPGHANTLEALGELALESKDYKEAQDYFQQSLQANPLDRDLRNRLAHARLKWALELTLAGKFDLARVQYENALKLWEGSKITLLCQWAVAEIKAKNPSRAEELIAQAQAPGPEGARADQRLACCYALVGASVRARLTPKLKKELNDQLKAALEQAPAPAEVLALLEVAAQQRHTHDETFRGQKAQEKIILKFLDQQTYDAFGETQLERLCAGLQALQARKPWLNCLVFARRRFLKNPFFRLSWVDYYLTGSYPEEKIHLAREHLDQARRLVEALPRGETQQQWLERIQEKEKLIADLSAGRFNMFNAMNRIFSQFAGDPEENEGYADDAF